MADVYRLADDDEIYARGASQLRIPAGFRAALMRQAMSGAIRFMAATLPPRAKKPRWWSKSRRCASCAKTLIAKQDSPDVLEIDLSVRLDSGLLMVRLLTPGLMCRCGVRSYVNDEEVRELASDVLACCEFTSGVQPSGAEERARRRAEVRRVQ